MAGVRLETQHLLLGILQVEGLGAELLQSRGITLDTARLALSQSGIAPSPVVLKRATACKDCHHLVIDGDRMSSDCTCFARHRSENRSSIVTRANPERIQAGPRTGTSRTYSNCTLFRSKDA